MSELSAAIKRTLEGAFGYVRLRGEISGFRGAHSSGHCYFALKDDKAKIEAVIWRTTVQGLKFKPAEGLEVIATGRITTYPGKSNYQIVIDALEPAGIGALMALLEERKKKLAAEGLFDEARKKSRCPTCRASSASSPRRPAPSSATCCTASTSASRRACWCGRCGCRARPAPPRWPPPSAASTRCPWAGRCRAPTC